MSPIGSADFRWTLSFLAARAIPGVEEVEPTRYRRSLRVGGRAHLIEITLELPRRRHRVAAIRAWPPLSERRRIAIAATLFDLHTDLRDFQRLARRDPILAPLVRQRPGLRMPGVLDQFECGVRAIVGQVVSVAAARTILGRIVARYGGVIAGPAGERSLVFPTPERMARANPAVLRRTGLTTRKVHAIIELARAAEGPRGLGPILASGAGKSEASHLPGIGPWTLAYLRMRAGGDRDAFPATDHGVTTALARLGISRNHVSRIAERWRPWRAYATLYLWASLAE